MDLARNNHSRPLKRRPPRLDFAHAALCGLFALAFALHAQAKGPSAETVPGAASTHPDNQPRCVISGTREISIACDYTAMPPDSGQAASKPQIALSHAELAFDTKEDNWVRLSFRFTRLDNQPLEPRRVYLAIDDDRGNNFIRRPLPAIDLAALATGQSSQLEQHLLFPALQPGHYQISLWIPSNDPLLKFKAANNWLVSSYGVPDVNSGLNRIAAFSVVR
jgi:hypothetical protein